MAKITLRDGRAFDAPDDQRLVLAIEDFGVDILHRCGGFAQCTTCRVAFLSGEPTRMTSAELERLQARNIVGQFRLSCQIVCDHDMRVDVVHTLSNSDLTDAGSRPADTITPDPVWIDTPAAPASE
ncbi:MAG: 2Fe-2S iron-sulfur cluster-binding protein [Chloroflexota bacterium]|nr:2Fe-2S iron-sulfur cluster-binding protein [Chloroflexota bacterium]